VGGRDRRFLDNAIATKLASWSHLLDARDSGLPPLEAMSLGCPVLASPCGAVPEICGAAAIYVDPTDPSAWRDEILALLEDPRRSTRMKTEGLLIASKITWHNAAISLARVLQRLIQTRFLVFRHGRS